MSQHHSITIYDKKLSLEQLIKSIWGNDAHVRERRALGGGCIGDVKKLLLHDGLYIIHKSYSKDSRKDKSPEYRAMVEAIGLQKIADTHTIDVPTLYAVHGNSLLISYHHSERPNNARKFWDTFASKLSSLHKINVKNNLYGFVTGSYEQQANEHPHYTHEDLSYPHKHYKSWIEFYTQERIWKQCLLAEKNRYFDTYTMKQAEMFCTNLPSLIDEPQNPSIIHGDLWGGNYLCVQDSPLLIDPSVHIAHYESEISLTSLFGGYPQIFRDAYSTNLPLDKGFYTERIHIYNLYHILNHLNLFGRSYYHQAIEIIKRFA